MVRAIKKIARTITPVAVPERFNKTLTTWLHDQAKKYKLTYLLAHADDGVIWGRVKAEQLLLSHRVFPSASPLLQATTLQQARLFGTEAELLLWPNHAGWQARLIEDDEDNKDGKDDTVRYYDEAQVLWGNARQPESTADFTLVADGEMGHRHALPVAVAGPHFSQQKQPYRPLRLVVRHYLSRDEKSGLLRVTLSRLTDLYAEEVKA